MRRFTSLGTNQIALFHPEDQLFHIASEIVFCTQENEYNGKFNTESKMMEFEKYPKIETLRFVADVETIQNIISRLQDEVKVLEAIALKNRKEEE